MIPLVIKMMSWAYPVTNYLQEYGPTAGGTINESTGEIRRFTFKDKFEIGKQVLSSGYEGDVYYDYIWRHLGGQYYKCTSKTRYYGIS